MQKQSSPPPNSTATIRAELHSHSTCSDGEFAPDELARLMAEAGVELWSLTDHDTVAGCEEARQAAEEHGIAFLDGIEISAWAGRSVHVLGYGVDPSSEALQRFVARRTRERVERMEAMIERLKGLGVYVDLAHIREIADDAAVLTRPHLAQAIYEKGYLLHPKDAFSRYIGNDAPAYVEQTWPGVEEAIDIIHAAAGAAVLAHPAHYELDDQIPAWAEAGLDGVEVDHPSHTSSDVARYRKLAEELGLVCTVSSDFHGLSDRLYRQDLGGMVISEAWVEALKGRVGR